MMKKLLLAVSVAIMSVSAGSVGVRAADFTLSSPDIQEQQRLPESMVFKGFGCEGGNVSPALSWAGAPEGTKSFAITMYDPDAPTGSGWWHWVAFDIPASVTSLDAGASRGAMPDGTIESRTDYGTYGFGGACPPVGDKDHHYILSVYALDVATLGVDKDASAALVGFNIHAHTIGKASITGLYSR